jgi:hypothetical protein
MFDCFRYEMSVSEKHSIRILLFWDRSTGLEDRAEDSLDSSQSALFLSWETIHLSRQVIVKVPHAGEDINVAGLDPQRSVCWSFEPTVDLPDQIEEDKQGTSEVGLEPGNSVQVRTADGIKCDVELGKESEYRDKYDEVRAPDTESCLVRQLIKRAAIVFPFDH